MKTALLIVDVQNDFLPGGALAVPGGDEVVEPLLAAAGTVDLIVASRDAHTEHHVSFAARGGPWPAHCVIGTHGCELEQRIGMLPIARVVDKANRDDWESYSAFSETGLAEYLRSEGVERVVVGGIASDYCVRASALDAIREGFDVVLLEDGCRGVDVAPGDSKRALAEVAEAGARRMRSDVLARA